MVKEIPLTQGKFALVDNEDYDFISKYKWHAGASDNNVFYALRSRRYREPKTNKRMCEHVRMHSEIMGTRDGFMVDHIDGDGLNNTRNNLRFVTERQNISNRHQPKHSKYPGVSKNAKLRYNLEKPWMASITVDGKKVYLGRYKTEYEAYSAYCKKCSELGFYPNVTYNMMQGDQS